MPETYARRLISLAAWPCAIVETDGIPTGFVMPTIPDRFYMPLGTVKGVVQVPAEAQHLLNQPDVLAARGIELDDRRRLKLIYEVVSALEFLHQQGVCVGDFSPKNLLFSSAIHDDVYFVDCDTMRVNGISAMTQIETPGWEVPAGEELATNASDVYKLGLFALRLLVGDQDVKDPNKLPPPLASFLGNVIAASLDPNPAGRPDLAIWKSALENAATDLQQKKLYENPGTSQVADTPLSAAFPQLRSRPVSPNAKADRGGEIRGSGGVQVRHRKWSTGHRSAGHG